VQDLLTQSSGDFFAFWKAVLESGDGKFAVVAVVILLLTPLWLSLSRLWRERVRRSSERCRAENEQAAVRAALEADTEEKRVVALKVLWLLREKPALEADPPDASEDEPVNDDVQS